MFNQKQIECIIKSAIFYPFISYIQMKNNIEIYKNP